MSEDLPEPAEDLRAQIERYQAWAEAREWQRAEACRRVALIEAVPEAGTVEEKRAALRRFKDRTPAAEQPQGVTLSTFYRYAGDFAEGGLPALLPKPSRREGVSKIDPRDYERFRSLYLTREERSASECYRLAKGAAALREGRAPGELHAFPSPKTFFNTLRRREPEAVVVMARHGVEEYRRWQQRQPRREAQQHARRPQHQTGSAEE